MKLLILDRDGVINEDSDEYIKSPAEWVAIPGSLEAIARFNKAGFRVVVATNQSGVGRGYYDIETLREIHDKMQLELSQVGGRIDTILFCPHTPSDDCPCRKPKPGMLYGLMDRIGCDMSEAFFVGDSLRDLQAAMATGAQPVLVKTGKGERTLLEAHIPEPVVIYDDLATFADAILNEDK